MPRLGAHRLDTPQPFPNHSQPSYIYIHIYIYILWGFTHKSIYHKPDPSCLVACAEISDLFLKFVLRIYLKKFDGCIEIGNQNGWLGIALLGVFGRLWPGTQQHIFHKWGIGIEWTVCVNGNEPFGWWKLLECRWVNWLSQIHNMKCCPKCSPKWCPKCSPKCCPKCLPDFFEGLPEILPEMPARNSCAQAQHFRGLPCQIGSPKWQKNDPQKAPK